MRQMRVATDTGCRASGPGGVNNEPERRRVPPLDSRALRRRQFVMFLPAFVLRVNRLVCSRVHQSQAVELIESQQARGQCPHCLVVDIRNSKPDGSVVSSKPPALEGTSKILA